MDFSPSSNQDATVAASAARVDDGGETATGVLVEGGGCEWIFTPLERLC